MPLVDARRVARLPEKPFSKEQCYSYLAKLTKKVEAQVSNEDKSLVKAILAKTSRRASAAVGLWYNKSVDAALLLAFKAAQPDSVLSLSNLGAILNQLGHEEKAVPLLEYGLRVDAANPNVLNNLGRAYLGLGKQEKAKKFC